MAEVHHQADGGEGATIAPEMWEPDELRFPAAELST